MEWVTPGLTRMPFVVKSLDLSIFIEWLFYTGFTVFPVSMTPGSPGKALYSQGRSGLPCEFDADLW